MSVRHTIIAVLCFLLAGCTSQYQISNGEFKARDHMRLAAEIETSLNFQAAIKAYAHIIERYPDTSYYKAAIWKVAVLNLYPDNPTIDYTAAQDWLQLYLTLPLSPNEKETAQLYTAFIQQINQGIQDKKRHLALIEQQKKENTDLSEKLKFSRADAAQTKNKLEKIKAIDVQMHNAPKTPPP